MTRQPKKKPLIIVDTREQMPYAFSPAVDTVRQKLDTGDYSAGILFAEEITPISACVERKTLADFIGSVIHQRDRFMREVERMSQFNYKCIVVEGSIQQVLNHDYESAVHPNSIIGSAIAISVDHGVPVYFFDNRQIAEMWVEKYLVRIWNQMEEQNGDSTTNAIAGSKRESFIDLSEEIYPPWIGRVDGGHV